MMMAIIVSVFIVLGIVVNLIAKHSVDNHRGYGGQEKEERYWNR
jgi:hypothetical protein